MKIGVIGLGRMGSGIALRLAARGHQVSGWDIDPMVCDAKRSSRSVSVLGSAVAVVQSSEVIITSLPEDAGIKHLFYSDRGLLGADIGGKLFIEMSTLKPGTATELAAAVGELGADIIDAPVLGSIAAAETGTLIALTGGSPQAILKATPILSDVTSRIFHLGPNGSGYAMKLAVNLGLAGYIQALSESLALGESYGIDMESMLQVLSAAPTANAWLAAKLPGLAGNPYQVTLDLATMRKDLMSAVASGASRGVPMPLSAAALTAFSAAVAAGWGSRDCGEQTQFFRGNMPQRYDYSSKLPK